jgi:hypothetical protein
MASTQAGSITTLMQITTNSSLKPVSLHCFSFIPAATGIPTAYIMMWPHASKLNKNRSQNFDVTVRVFHCTWCCPLLVGLKPNPHQLDYLNGREKKSDTRRRKAGNGGKKCCTAFTIRNKPHKDRSSLEWLVSWMS